MPFCFLNESRIVEWNACSEIGESWVIEQDILTINLEGGIADIDFPLVMRRQYHARLSLVFCNRLESLVRSNIVHFARTYVNATTPDENS